MDMIDPVLVSKFIKMLSNKDISSTEAKSLAATLDSREEFLAYLIVRTNFLDLHSEVRIALEAVAKESGYEASTKREVDGPLAAARGSISELGTTLRSVIEAEKASTTSYAKIAELEQQIVRLATAKGRDERSPERWIKSPKPAQGA
jgi:hypothetical protein